MAETKANTQATDPAKSSAEKFHEALRLANEACRDMGSEAREAVVGQYSHLKELFDESRVGDRLHEAGDYTSDKAKELGAKMDESVHEQPYAYIGGAAFACLVLGVFLGRK